MSNTCFRKECTNEATKGGKYCSMSCAAKVNNQGRVRNGSPHYCANPDCNIRIAHNKLYCSNECKNIVSYNRYKKDEYIGRICTYCEKEYDYTTDSGHTLTACNSCKSNRRRFVLKQKCVDYKGGKCVKCGYDKCLHSLDFHHVDPTTKSFSISGNHTRKWDTVKKELDKCILVCRNCHGEIHFNEIQNRYS